jgi:hypothetical protein
VEQDHVAADRSPHSRGVRLRDERIRDAVEAGDEFGFTTFAADVVGERHTDLVVAAPAEDVDSATDLVRCPLSTLSRNRSRGERT